MPGYKCSVAGCNKEAWAKLDKSTGVMCGGHIKLLWRPFQIPGMLPTAVSNPLHDPKSQNEHRHSGRESPSSWHRSRPVDIVLVHSLSDFDEAIERSHKGWTCSDNGLHMPVRAYEC